MGISPVISALVRKRGDILGLIRELEQKIAVHEDALSHVDATIAMFSDEIDPATIPARRPYRRRNVRFKAGELRRSCLVALRVAGEPITAADVVLSILRDRGLTEPDIRTHIVVARLVTTALRALRGRELIDRLGETRGARWFIVEKDEAQTG